MVNYSSSLVLLSFVFTHLSFYSSLTGAATHNVTSYGAKPDGTTDSSEAFLDAWRAACGSRTTDTIYVSQGQFLINSSLVFTGTCNGGSVTFLIDGTLVAPSDYCTIGEEEAWLMFKNVDGVSVYGGTLDGQGTELWDCKTSGGSCCPEGATSLEFKNSKNIMISGLTSLNSQKFHIVINRCSNVSLQAMNVTAPHNSPNTDGIHVESSTGVTISGSVIGTGDDCISVGPGVSNLWIQDIACGPGHGISIGSLGWKMEEVGVRDVTVKGIIFTGSENGVRIKTWGRLSKSVVKNVLYSGIAMINVLNPILIDQNYCPHKSCPHQQSGVQIDNVSYVNIFGTSAKKAAVTLTCSATHPCTNIELQDIKLTYQNHLADTSLTNVQKSSGPPSSRIEF